MKYPSLVPERVCTTDIRLIIYREGISEDGEPLTAFEHTGKCNFQNVSSTKYTADKIAVTITGTALFTGDICPDIPNISDGRAFIYGNEYRIFRGSKQRNPDGTVNYTRLEVV